MSVALGAGGTAPSSTRAVVRLATVAALGGFLFGFDTSVINGAVSAVQDEFNASDLVIGLTVSSALIGSAIGAWYAGRLADRYSRVNVMVLAAALFVISAIGSGFPPSIWWLLFWRVIGGLGVGIASVVAPTYIAEIAPAHMRGRLGSLQQLAIVTGIFIALLSDFLLASLAGGSAGDELWGLEAWNWMFLAGIIPAVVYGVMSMQLPKSPRWLVAKGRESEAAVVIDKVEGIGLEAAQRRASEIGATMVNEVQPTVRDLRGPRAGLLPIVWVGIFLSVLQQFVGINVIFYYSSVLWQAVGFDESDSLLISTITGVVNIGTTILAISLIDKVGRRPLLLFGSGGMTVCLLALTVLFATATENSSGDPELNGAAGVAALLAANGFVFFFGFSWGPCVWVLLGEIFPNRIRAAALSVAAAAQWAANFLVSATFPSLAAISLGLAYGIYTAFAAISFFFVQRIIVETKGRTLEELSDASSS